MSFLEALKYALAMTYHRVLDLARQRRPERHRRAKRGAWGIASLDEIVDDRRAPGETAHRQETVAQIRRQLPSAVAALQK